MSHLIVYLSLIFSLLTGIISTVSDDQAEFCKRPDEFSEYDDKCGAQRYFSRNRYILYDVNPPEGFNLRRDVYIRAAVFVKHLAESDTNYQWHLVLPPWGNLYHWRSKNAGPQIQLPWSMFFDISSLQKYAPVIEMFQFFEAFKSSQLDCIYILQNDEEMFKTGDFKDKNEIVDCSGISSRYQMLKDQTYAGYFWGYTNITTQELKCVKFHGMMSSLEKNLNPERYRAVIFDHMEIPLHDYYGSLEYWKARRSMRYNSNLYKIANLYRKEYLNSTDDSDNTNRPTDWTKEKSKRDAIGGPYLSVHLRRSDFLVGRGATVPTIKSAASQLKKKLDENKLDVLFVATDAEEREFKELQSLLPEYKVLRFSDSKYGKKKFKDGEMAIIDQIICSYARYFVGTYESTFTFRIQEDREIIGFPPERTFNVICKNKCPTEGRWEIVW